MEQTQIQDSLKMVSGFEAMSRGDFAHEDAIYFSVIHNQMNNKPIYRSPRDAMIEDGMESIAGTIQEWLTRASRTIKDLFKNYDKQETARIEKEVKGGMDAFKTASIKDAITAIKKVRETVVRDFDKVYDGNTLGSRPFFKGLDKKQAKEKLLKEIDHAIHGMENPKMTDFYMAQIKKNSEKYMLKIVAKLNYLKRTHVKYKHLLDKKLTHDFFLTVGFYPNKLEEIRKGGDTIIRKLEMIEKNGTVFLDIAKSKIFIDLGNYVTALFTFLNMALERMEKVYDAANGAKDSQTIAVAGHDFKPAELRTIIFEVLYYVQDTYEALDELGSEVSENILRTSLSMTGIPEYCIDVFVNKGK